MNTSGRYGGNKGIKLQNSVACRTCVYILVYIYIERERERALMEARLNAFACVVLDN
jgi:hypothetical protein